VENGALVGNADWSAMADRPSVPRDSRFLSILKGRPDESAYVGECGSDWNWWVDEGG